MRTQRSSTRLASTASVPPMSIPSSYDFVRNAVLLVVLWVAYSTVRTLTAGTEAVAVANAELLLDFQRHIGLDIEDDVQRLIDGRGPLVVANFYYLMHFPVTAIVLIAAYLRDRHGAFVVLRNALVAATAVALVIHMALPLAPPRLLPGFVDTGALYGPDPYRLPGSGSANQFAAMPSMHVAWAILAGYSLWTFNLLRGVRALAIIHPIATVIVVLATGHHFVTDVVIGAALPVAAIVVQTRQRQVAQPVRSSAPMLPHRSPGFERRPANR
ncbi:MAG: phosphatase PAP2 family protein [Acidimicrobiales bacterium]